MDEPAEALPPPGPMAPYGAGAASGGSRPGSGDDFAIDMDLIKILASDSRRDILRLLKTRRMTLTELAAALQLKKATVLEHLKRLTDAGLIRRLEDDRLWVYYELTHRGGRVVNPGRTRFYLLMGVTAAALVLGGIVAAAVLQAGPGMSTTTPLHVEVQDAAATGGSLALEVKLEKAPGARAYLLDADEVDALHRDDRVLGGIPLGLAEVENGVARFRSFSPVPAGTYYLYVVDEEGRDNRASLSAVRIPSLVAEGPTLLWRGVDAGATFRVTRDGEPTNGTLLLVASEGRELPTLPLVDGEARLDAETLDRLTPATYTLQLLPVGSQFWIVLDAHLEVRDPAAVVSPLQVAAGAPVSFRVEGLPEAATLRASTFAFAARSTADARDLDAEPLPPGSHKLLVGRTLEREVVAHRDALLSFNATSERLTLRATEPTGEPFAGALLQLDDATLGTTDEDGTIDVAPTTSGTRRLTLIADGAPVLVLSRAVHFDGFNVSEPASRVVVDGVRAAAVGRELRIDVTLDNRGPVDEPATLVAYVDERPVASVAVEAPALRVSTHTLAATGALLPGDHTVRVRLVPLERAPIAFRNLTAPAGSTQLTSAPASDGFTASARYLADGSRNATTTIVLRHGATEPESGVDFSAPSPVAAASDRAPAVPGPGAALVVLALVVAVLVLRRRR